MASNDQSVLKMLRAQCASLGLSTTGTKAALTDRIKAHSTIKPSARVEPKAAAVAKVTSFTIPTDFYEAEKKDLLECGFNDPEVIEREIEERYQVHMSAAPHDANKFVFHEPMNEHTRISKGLIFVGMTDEGEFEYKKASMQPKQPKLATPVVSAGKPGKSIKKSSVASSSKHSGAKAAISKLYGAPALAFKNEKGKQVKQEGDSGEADKPMPDFAFFLSHVKKRLMKKASLPVVINFLKGCGMIVPGSLGQDEYFDLLANQLVLESDDDEDA